MKTVDEVQNIIHIHLDELRQRFGVAQIGIFGSFVKNEQNIESDVDILVEFSKPIGFIHFIRLEQFLQKLIGSKIDLVTKKALKPYIGKHILDEVRYVQ